MQPMLKWVLRWGSHPWWWAICTWFLSHAWLFAYPHYQSFQFYCTIFPLKFDFHSILKQPITTIVSFGMMGCYSFCFPWKSLPHAAWSSPFPQGALPLALHTSISKQIGIKLANSDLIPICFEIPITQIISKPSKNWQFWWKNWQFFRQFYIFSNLLRTVVLYQKPIL